MNDPKPPDPAPSPRPRRFDAAFKREAVALVADHGQPVKQVARELGISEFLLYEWRRAFRPELARPRAPQPPTPSRPAAELEAENLRLRRELERVSQQRDILKKTLGILSEPPNSASSASRR